ncbi:MAG: alpha-amylase C-terminal beta-sheet domain-containing protein, partial [Elusimicrobiaceae bacterium]
AVMLQGFHWFADSYWYHPQNGWWGELARWAPEIGKAGFDIVWFPPASIGAYYAREWYNFNGQWGNQDWLVKAIAAMHAQGLVVLADVVFNHRSGSTDWADFKNPDWPTSVVVRNDEWQGGPKSENDDQGQGDFGSRDIDHTKQIVQTDCAKFLQYLRRIGFDGWRYDMVKGYPGYYVGLYNQASRPLFSVGEYFDGDRQTIINWIDSTDMTPGKRNASSAFDFPNRFALINAIENNHYESLNDGGRPPGILGVWPEKAVTFVDNHDTAPRDAGFMPSAPEYYRQQRMVGYAYILTHPGVPCVFWPNFFDWGDVYKNKIKKLIQIRKEAGITSTSPVYIVKAEYQIYTAIITGTKRQVAVKLGPSWRWTPGADWQNVENGESYAIWMK